MVTPALLEGQCLLFILLLEVIGHISLDKLIESACVKYLMTK